MVGDQNFNRKCQYELLERRKDRTMILASHSTHLVKELCNRAVLIDNGSATVYEDVDAAVERYTLL